MKIVAEDDSRHRLAFQSDVLWNGHLAHRRIRRKDENNTKK
jgi:hypothetical protein